MGIGRDVLVPKMSQLANWAIQVWSRGTTRERGGGGMETHIHRGLKAKPFGTPMERLKSSSLQKSVGKQLLHQCSIQLCRPQTEARFFVFPNWAQSLQHSALGPFMMCEIGKIILTRNT